MNIIAYGSLMNQSSLEKTLQRSARLERVRIKGYARIFNAPFDGFAFLNLMPAKNTAIETAVFEMSPDELRLFSEREAGSDLIEVMPGYFAFIWPTEQCQTLPVLQSYIDICQQGADSLSINLEQGLIKPQTVFDDRLTPLYP